MSDLRTTVSTKAREMLVNERLADVLNEGIIRRTYEWMLKKGGQTDG